MKKSPILRKKTVKSGFNPFKNKKKGLICAGIQETYQRMRDYG